MLDSVKYRGKSINLSRKGYAPQPTKLWLDGWINRYNPYAHTLLYLLIELTPYKDSNDWRKGVLEISMRDVTKELGWSHNTVDKTMQMLYEDGIITWTSNSGRYNNTTISFCNYDGMFEINMSQDDNLNNDNMSPNKPLNNFNVSPDETLDSVNVSPDDKHNINYHNTYQNRYLSEERESAPDIKDKEERENEESLTVKLDEWYVKKSRSDLRNNIGSLLNSDGFLSPSALDAFNFQSY